MLFLDKFIGSIQAEDVIYPLFIISGEYFIIYQLL